MLNTLKPVVVLLLFWASSSSFAIRAPEGDFIFLSCSSVSKTKAFQLLLLDNAKTDVMKFEIVDGSGDKRTYKPVSVKVSERVGGPTTYSAPATGGNISLVYNATTAPGRDGMRKATLVASSMGIVTKTELRCSRVNY
jgi:hypothetical protein